MSKKIIAIMAGVVVIVLATFVDSQITTVAQDSVEAVEQEVNYSEIYEAVGSKYAVSPEFIEALSEAVVIADTDAIGCMHVRPDDCANEMSELDVAPKDLINPEINIEVGTLRLLNLFEEYSDPDIVLGEYLHEDINSAVVNFVLDRSVELESEHGK